MKTSEEQEEAEKLEREIRKHNYLYYEIAQPIITDYQYDMLWEKLKKLNPDAKALQEVGYTPSPDDEVELWTLQSKALSREVK